MIRPASRTAMKINPPKICIVTPEFPPARWGGLARTAHRVGQIAARSGYEVHVLHFMIQDGVHPLLDENRRTEPFSGTTLHTVEVGRERMPPEGRTIWDCPHALSFRMMFQSLEKLVGAHDFSLLHSFFLYPMGYAAGLTARRHGPPHLATLLGNDVNKYFFSPEKAAFCRCGLENADRIVSMNRDMLLTAKALTRSCPDGEVVYNSVVIPEQSWRVRTLESDEPFVLGFAGIFKYAKGLPYLIKAAKILSGLRPVKLSLVGEIRPGEREMFEHMLDREEARSLVELRPPLRAEEMGDWFLSLDAFALSSVSEGCPNVLMEAMAHGLPCAATRVGAVEDLIEPEVSGLIVPPGDGEGLAKALARIMRDPGLAANLGRAARERMGLFSPEREAEAWSRIYREMIG